MYVSEPISYCIPVSLISLTPDAQLLRPSHPPPFSAAYHSSRPAAGPPRISLPNTNVSFPSPRQVLGDASHHFRPFIPHSEDHRPQFISNPLQTQPSPETRSIFGRDGSRRVASLQPGAQLATPPFYRGMSQTASCRVASLTVTSPTSPGTTTSRTARIQLVVLGTWEV